MIQVTKNVYVENNMLACNLGMVTTSEGNVLIDSPMRPTDAVKWVAEVKKHGETQFIINTEEHPDHWLGSHFLPGILVTNQDTRDKVAKANLKEINGLISHIDPEGVPLMAGFRNRLAAVVFQKNLTLYVGCHTFHLFPLPGHCTSGIGIFVPEEKVVFVADMVFNQMKSWLNEADPAVWLESLETINTLDVDVIVPGHGKICGKDYLKEEGNIIKKWESAVRTAIKQGMSLPQALVEIKPPDPFAKQPGTPMTDSELDKAIITHLYKLYSK